MSKYKYIRIDELMNICKLNRSLDSVECITIT